MSKEVPQEVEVQQESKQLPEKSFSSPPKASLVRRIWRWMGFEAGKDYFTVLNSLMAVIVTATVAIFGSEINRNLQQETAMQTYLDQTTRLLLKDDGKQLYQLAPDTEAKALLSSRTTILLEQLDPTRSERIVRFLAQAGLLPEVSAAGADLSGSNLSAQDLRNSDLSNADLRDANLRDANLRDANLRGANLTGAILDGADLSGADLRDAVGSTRQQLEQASSLEGAIMPDGSIYRQR